MSADAAKGKRNVWTVVLVVAAFVLVASLAALGVIAYSYFQGQQKYDKLEEYVSPVQAASPVKTADDGETASDAFTVDWDSLKAINSDTVAWLLVPNSAINYPVVRGSDNDYYLTHDFEGVQGWLANYGTIFMDYRNSPIWSDQCYFLYGHHMNDGSMFADIAGMRDQARFDECRTLYLMSPSKNFNLRSFALIRCSADDSIVQQSFESPEAMAAYVQDKIDRSIVSVPDAPAADSVTQVFAFSTCDNVGDGRYVLFAYAV